MKFIEINVNETFGRLTTLEQRQRSATYILCLCSCGNKKRITISHLLKGAILSCGCIQREMMVERATKHGESRFGGKKRSVEYDTWCSIHSRCSDKNKDAFKNYGGRGIKVCERWSDFQNFLEDVGRRPSDEHSIDRINNDGDYEPSNVKWSTRIEQANNKRNSKKR